MDWDFICLLELILGLTVDYPWDNIYPKAIVAWYPVCVSFNKRFNQRINYLKKTEIQQSLPISNLKIIAPTKDNYEDNPKTEW